MRLSLSSVLSQTEDPLLHCQRLLLLRETFTEISSSSFHLVKGVVRLDILRDCPRDKTLCVAPQTQHQMQRAFLLDVVIRQCYCTLRLLTRQCFDKDLHVISQPRHKIRVESAFL